MGSNSGPNIVENGLVLALDATNSKSILNSVEVLVVAGGGGGGTGGGGGGSGGLIYNKSFAVTPGSAITATVGAGGSNNSTWGGSGGPGSNSVFGTLTAIGGGGGQHRAGATSSGTGGSGGGDAGGSGFTLSNATLGQGFSGGNSPKNGTTLEEPGGGGGGAGGTGENASTPTASDGATVRATLAGAGGSGLPVNISGSNTYYAGGGGGSNRNGIGKSGGIGGGGTGGTSPTAGTTNTGGGGGGTGYIGYGGGGTSASGGSGIVIVRYPGSQKATGGTITSVGGYTIHTFTTSDTFTPGMWADLSLNGKNGTLTGSPTISNGVFQFNGSNYIQIPSINLSSGTYTVIGAARYSGATRGRMITGISNNWLMGHWGNSVANHYAEGWVSGAGVGGSDTNWRIYTVTGNTATDTWSFYINGILNVSNTGGSAGPNGLQVPQANGEQSIGECGFILAYSRVLTDDEILQNFNALRGRFGI